MTLISNRILIIIVNKHINTAAIGRTRGRGQRRQKRTIKESRLKKLVNLVFVVFVVAFILLFVFKIKNFESTKGPIFICNSSMNDINSNLYQIK